MLVLVVILTICAIVCSCIAYANDEYLLCGIAGVGACILGVVALFIIICTCGLWTDIVTINDKIKMYTEENKIIEEQMTTIVQNYEGYEKEIVSNIADMEVMLIKFPELKTSELVSKQMNVYIENNNKIKELKNRKIDTKITKWLLYFGK